MKPEILLGPTDTALNSCLQALSVTQHAAGSGCTCFPPKSNNRAIASRRTHQGINFAGVQLTQAGGDEGAKGMGHDTGGRPAMLDKDACQGVRHFIDVHAAGMQPHGHMRHVQKDHRPAAVFLPHELADEAPVWYLDHRLGP